MWWCRENVKLGKICYFKIKIGEIWVRKKAGLFDFSQYSNTNKHWHVVFCGYHYKKKYYHPNDQEIIIFSIYLQKIVWLLSIFFYAFMQ
jgi:hypothetical protein